MRKIKCSVIIPVYNQETLIIRALESIPTRDDIEIIVVDDASTDNTYLRVLRYIGATDKNVVFLYNEENKGVGYSVNKGIDNATGEYIVLLGSDDYFTKEFSLDYLDGTDLVYFNLQINNNEVWRVNENTKRDICGSVKFMRKDFIGNTRNPEKRFAEDSDFYKKLLKKNPTEKFTDIVMKHYNYPRKGSLCDIALENLKRGIKND